MVRFASQDGGAACAADTLFTSGRDGGDDVADRLQDGAVGGYRDDGTGHVESYFTTGSARERRGESDVADPGG